MGKKQNWFSFIKKFLNNLLKKQKMIESPKIIEGTTKNKMLDNFKTEKELLNLQQKYEKGQILEKELSEKQKKELEKLYKKQIETLKQEIIMYKREIEFYRTRDNN